jgi:uncharacterized membrane protein YhaH (DUF805 family)
MISKYKYLYHWNCNISRSIFAKTLAMCTGLLIAATIILVVAMFFSTSHPSGAPRGSMFGNFIAPLLILVNISMYMYVCVILTINRLHNMRLSGWWSSLYLVAMILSLQTYPYSCIGFVTFIVLSIILFTIKGKSTDR